MQFLGYQKLRLQNRENEINKLKLKKRERDKDFRFLKNNKSSNNNSIVELLVFLEPGTLKVQKLSFLSK